jgi:hypothetical protein
MAKENMIKAPNENYELPTYTTMVSLVKIEIDESGYYVFTGFKFLCYKLL